MNKLILPWAIIASSSILAKIYAYSESADVGTKLTEWKTLLGRCGTAREQILGYWDIGLNLLIFVSLSIVIAGTIVEIKKNFKEKI